MRRDAKWATAVRSVTYGVVLLRVIIVINRCVAIAKCRAVTYGVVL